MVNFRKTQQRNKQKTAILLFMMAALMATLTYIVILYFGNQASYAIPFAIIIAILSVWGSYYGSDKLVISLTRAKIITAEDNPNLFALVNEISLASGLPIPKIAVIQDVAPNAFATGRDPQHALVAFTTGMLDKMDKEELRGVVAHEMSHIANRDTLVSAVAATTAGVIALIYDITLRVLLHTSRATRNKQTKIPIALAIIPLLLAPLAATMLKAAISRKREALADATAVSFTRNPASLRSALEKLAEDSTVVQARSSSLAHLYIESPLDQSLTSKLFATHPPIQTRIAELKKMEYK